MGVHISQFCHPDRELQKVRAQIVPNLGRETLQNVLLKNIKYDSIVCTDNAIGYDKVKYNFLRDVVVLVVDFGAWVR